MPAPETSFDAQVLRRTRPETQGALVLVGCGLVHSCPDQGGSRGIRGWFIVSQSAVHVYDS